MRLFLKRAEVAEVLRISVWSTYDFFPARRLALIHYSKIVNLLNMVRRHAEPSIETVPDDLQTLAETARFFGLEPAKLRRWCNWRRKGCPHFRLNQRALLFRIESVNDWLKGLT